MWIMIAGPYRSGASSEAERAQNLRTLNVAARDVFLRGHVPVVGVNLALPIIEAGGDDEAVMMPLSLALAERCDAVLRIGGASHGADQEVERFRERGRPVYGAPEEIPPADGATVPSRRDSEAVA